MQQLSIEEAIEKKASSMKIGRSQDSKVIKEKCPQCGAEIVCVYADLGPVDYYDTYVHICRNPECDFILSHESFSCNMGGGRAGPINETCWFCKRPISMTW